MALGRRRDEQQAMWVATTELARSPGHPFYDALNRLLRDGGFDPRVEVLCEPYYAKCGRPSVPPGTYFRMLFIGYFEGIDSQRGIAWRCADSLSHRDLLEIAPTARTPDHSTRTLIRQRRPLTVDEQVFQIVLELAAGEGLIDGKTIGVVATLVEANAAMKTIVRKGTREDWRAFVARLAKEQGVEVKDDEDLRRFDKTRKGKKASNEEWESSSDPDKGHHEAESLAELAGCGVRTYIPERREGQHRRWTDKPASHKAAVYANRRRVRGARSAARRCSACGANGSNGASPISARRAAADACGFEGS